MDHLDLNQTLARTDKEQLLLNLVRLRYADQPMFLEVVSVINQYALETEASLDVKVYPAGKGTGRWAERPTITYAPLKGERFAESMLRPLPPAALLFLIQTGWPVELVFRLAVRSIGPHHNRTTVMQKPTEADRGFEEVLVLLQELRDERKLAIRATDKKDGLPHFYLKADGQAKVARLRELLELEAGLEKADIIFGAVALSGKEVPIVTRSMLEVLAEASADVEAPAADLQSLRALPTLPTQGNYAIRVKPLPAKPEDAHVAVQYRKQWFAVAQEDYASKRMFTMLSLLLSLAVSPGTPMSPIVTVGAGAR